MNINRRMLLAAGITLGFVSACHPAKPVPAPWQMKAETNVPEGVVHRMKDLDGLIFHLRLGAGSLPGNSEADQRRFMGDSFSDISAILPLLQGPDRTGGFDEEVQLVDEARSRLAALPADVSSEPAIASGLRDTSRALNFICSSQFSEQADISKSLAMLGQTVNELDGVHDAIAWGVQADAVRQIGDIVNQMHEVLVQRMGKVAVPTAAPKPAAPKSDAPKLDAPSTRH